MSFQKSKGAACLVLAFAAVSSFAAPAAAAQKKNKKHFPPSSGTAVSSWQPEAAAMSTPAIWTGSYAGLSGGYAWGRSELQYDRVNHGIAARNPNGALGALTVGYNYDLGNGFVIGAEGDLGIADISASDRMVFDGHIYQSRFGPWWGTIRARAGYSFGETLVFATGGAAFMGMDEVVIGNTPVETAVNRDTRSGWVAGGGIEHAFAPNMTIKAEYLHMDFGSFNGFSGNRETFSFDNKVDLVRVGLNYTF